MTFEDFVARREAERAFAYANGYNNGDAATNGEYACLDALLAEADVLVDVGANEGLFAARAAARTPAPRILAFEPNPAHRALIESRLAGAGRLEGVALGDKPGSATLHIHATHHATASLTDRPRMSPRFRAEMTTVEVPVRRLDDWADELAGARLLIKIDAEGFEPLIFQGMEGILGRSPGAAIVTEVSIAHWQRFGDPPELLDRVRGARRLYLIGHDGKLTPIKIADLRSRVSPEFVSYVLLLPDRIDMLDKIQRFL